MDNNLLEINRIDRNSLGNEVRYWGVYAGFYEKLFKLIDNKEELLSTYKEVMRSPDLNSEGRSALTFFYRIRRDEIHDPEFWNKRKIEENKQYNMKAKLVKERLNEFYPENDLY